jgi:hypothetical protein
VVVDAPLAVGATPTTVSGGEKESRKKKEEKTNRGENRNDRWALLPRSIYIIRVVIYKRL